MAARKREWISLRPLERGLNAVLELDSQAADILAKLTDRCVELDVDSLIRRPLQVTFVNGRIRLGWKTESSPPADLHIAGTPLALLGALTDAKSGVQVLRPGVRIHGDLGFAKQMLALFRSLEPDFEEALSTRLGDLPARQLMRGGAGLARWVRASVPQAMHNLGEYLAHEAQLIAPLIQQRQFAQQVHELRDSVARLEARIALLQSKTGRSGC